MKLFTHIGLTIILGVFISEALSAQLVDSSAFLHASIQNKDLGTIRYHVYKKNIHKKLPVIFCFQGSMDLPLIGVKGPGNYLYTFSREVLNYADSFHIVLISKPGRYFKENIQVDSTGNLQVPLTATYNKHNTQTWRVQAGIAVIQAVLQQYPCDRTKVVAMGYSEGGQVVPELATKEKRITHLVSINGAGLNQFYDGIITMRINAVKYGTPPEVVQNNIDSLLGVYKKIYSNPNSLTLFHEDESYKRWYSYTAVDPLVYLRKLSIPIYMVASGNDDSSPILGLDYVALDFMRLGKNNLTYRVYPLSDHGFNEPTKTGEMVNKRSQVYREIINWINKN